MRIDVTYADRPPRVIETSGESMLSASTVAGSPEWQGAGLPVTATMLRPRTDLLMRQGSGLVVELCAWSAANDGWQEDATISDFGRDTDAPRMQFHVFRVWEVLPAEDVAHVVDIEIDGRIRVRRISGRLLDLTCYEHVEERLLSRAERNEHPLDQRVLLVHDRLRRETPGMTDAEAGAAYGLGTALIDYALSMGSGDEGEADGGVLTDDGFDGFASAYASAGNREALVLAVMDAIVEMPGLSMRDLARALGRRKLDASDLDDLWAEAEGRIEDEAAWGDEPWDEMG